MIQLYKLHHACYFISTVASTLYLNIKVGQSIYIAACIQEGCVSSDGLGAAMLTSGFHGFYCTERCLMGAAPGRCLHDEC